MDLIQRVTRFPAPNEKIQSESVDVAAGGPATNAAITAAALGARVTLLSAVGRHPLAALLKADLEAHHVTLLDATPDATTPPPVSAVTVLSTTGERMIVSRNAGATEVPVPEEGLPTADLTLTDGHHPELARAAARKAARLLIDAGSWRPVFPDLFPHAEVVACSADFRHPAATASGDDAATARAIAAPAVVITHGPAPVRWFTADASGEVPVPTVKAVDTAGAGDAFHGALAVAMLNGLPLPAATATASRTAAIRVSHAGPRSWLTHLV
ncbi:PfkB family carbohydrate kinase [Actinoplanes couchii]|uniref:Ribokinase n=1 Tax=Actinoplanes couchii TaxID=403638 RepID=A0ABQ3XCU3_9ACTN|nr:ribokinase [Actinoplanes couchii]